MSRLFLCAGAISGFLSVALGAFAAHALKTSLSTYSLNVFDTATQYHMVHSIALLLVSILLRFSSQSKLLIFSGYAFLSGIIVFSGSLYALAISKISILGAITPIGGLAFLTGWALLFIYALRSTHSSSI